jgi:hypothetical protein
MAKKNVPAESGAAEALASAEADIEQKRHAASLARRTLTDLETKLGDAHRRHAELAKERQDLAFAAHASGDAAAAARLTEIHREAGEQGSEIASIEAAIAEAANRFGAAEAALQRSFERHKLNKVLARLDHCRKLAAPLDKDAVAFFANLAEIFGAFGDLARIADSPPTGGHIRVLGARAVLTAAHEARHLLDLPFLAPSERITFTELTAGWLASVGGAADRRLAELSEAA